MELKIRLEHKLKEIAEFLLNHDTSYDTIGVLSGSSGVALFHFYYSQFANDSRHEDKGAEIMTRTFEQIQKGFTYPTFCNGIAGACWVLELLKEEQFIELEEDIITSEVDTYLYEKMKSFIEDNNFDFLHGAIGIGYYFLKRYENIQTSSPNCRYKYYLLELLNAIAKNAIQTKNFVKWKSGIISGSFRAEGYNLGLAHGIPSIILFLSKLAEYPIFNRLCFELLEPSCNYILSCKHIDESLTSSFPNWIVRDDIASHNSRLAWCYGDLGVGIALLQTAKTIKNETIYQEAIDLLQRTTNRKSPFEANITDPGLCHGSYGVMNMYLQMFLISDDTVFKDISDLWAQLSLDMIGFEDKNRDLTSIEPSLLDGTPGIGMALISYLNLDYTKWKEAFLIA